MRKIKLFGLLAFSLFFSLVNVKADGGLTEGIFDECPDISDIAEGYAPFYAFGIDKWVIVKISDISYEIKFWKSFPVFESKEELLDSIDEGIEPLESKVGEDSSLCNSDNDNYDECFYLSQIKNFREECEKHTFVGLGVIYADFFTPDGYKIDADSGLRYGLLNPINVTIELPDDLPDVKEGFTRKYYVAIFDHGSTPYVGRSMQDVRVITIDDVKVNDEGNLEFAVDSMGFSAVIQYEDVEISEEEIIDTTEETPIIDITEEVLKEEIKPANTFDGITNYLCMALISLVLILGITLFVKKQYN